MMFTSKKMHNKSFISYSEKVDLVISNVKTNIDTLESLRIICEHHFFESKKRLNQESINGKFNFNELCKSIKLKKSLIDIEASVALYYQILEKTSNEANIFIRTISPIIDNEHIKTSLCEISKRIIYILHQPVLDHHSLLQPLEELTKLLTHASNYENHTINSYT